MFQDFRAAGPLPPHSQLVRSPYGTPEHPLEPKRRPRGAGGAIFGFALLMTAGTFVAAVGGEYLTAPQPDVMLRTGIAFSADGLALVPYDRAGAGGLLSELATDVNAVRLAAVDLATGETRWDVQLADELDRDAAAVAAGEQYAYIATADGLEIRDLDDGALVTEAGTCPAWKGPGPARPHTDSIPKRASSRSASTAACGPSPSTRSKRPPPTPRPPRPGPAASPPKAPRPSSAA
nr:hypothetical protein GCM10025732_58230 [Glycomyces mayteni]